MAFPIGSEGSAPGQLPYEEEVSYEEAASTAHVDNETHIKAACDGLGTLEAGIDNTVDLGVETGRGKVNIEAGDQCSAVASSKDATASDLEVHDRLTVDSKVHGDQVDVYVTDVKRVRASAIGPGQLNLSVRDSLNLHVAAPTGFKVVVVLKQILSVITKVFNALFTRGSKPPAAAEESQGTQVPQGVPVYLGAHRPPQEQHPKRHVGKPEFLRRARSSKPWKC